MQNTLRSHITNYVNGDVSVESLSIAAQAEKADRSTANRVLMLISDTQSTHSMAAFRERMRSLI
jgi:hypothetical protein